MAFSAKDKVFIKVLCQERVTDRNSLSKSLQTKNAVREAVADSIDQMALWIAN